MKYTVKHPDGTTYDLTVEEMQSPLLVEQLKMDASWSVHHNGAWTSLNAFLWEQNQIRSHEPAEKASKQDSIYSPPSNIDKMLKEDASWSPGSIFGLVVRFIGLFSAGKGLMKIAGIFVGYLQIRMPAIQTIQNSSISSTLLINLAAEIIFVVLGLYLMRRPHKLVSLAFPEDN